MTHTSPSPLRDLGDRDLDPAVRERAEQRVAVFLAEPSAASTASRRRHRRLRPYAIAVVVAAALVVVAASWTSDSPDRDSAEPVAAAEVAGDAISDYGVFKDAPTSVPAGVRPGDRYALEHSGDGDLQAYAGVTFPDGSPGYVVATDKALCILVRRPPVASDTSSPAGDIAGGSCSPRPSRTYPGTVLFRPQSDGSQQVFALYPDGVTGLTLTGDGADREIAVRRNVAAFRRPADLDGVRVLANTASGDKDTHMFGR